MVAATVEALDVFTGVLRPFLVVPDGRRALRIECADGCAVPQASEQFTEAEDAFFLDVARGRQQTPTNHA